MLWAGYSYSNPVYTYGYTPRIYNVHTWKVQDYLESPSYTDINAVVYRYSVQKDVQSDLSVTVSNDDVVNGGYIFRETDDWSGVSGSTINKMIVLPNVPAVNFGEGRIDVVGEGTVLDPEFIYSYRLDTSGIVPVIVDVPETVDAPDIPEVDIYNVLEDSAITSNEAYPEYSDDQDIEAKGEEEERKERALRAASDSVGIGSTLAQQAMMAALMINTLERYEALQLDGGTYKESLTLNDAKLPDGKQGLRNGLAQQILHTKMVESQYGEIK